MSVRRGEIERCTFYFCPALHNRTENPTDGVHTQPYTFWRQLCFSDHLESQEETCDLVTIFQGVGVCPRDTGSGTTGTISKRGLETRTNFHGYWYIWCTPLSMVVGPSFTKLYLGIASLSFECGADSGQISHTQLIEPQTQKMLCPDPFHKNQMRRLQVSKRFDKFCKSRLFSLGTLSPSYRTSDLRTNRGNFKVASRITSCALCYSQRTPSNRCA